MGRRVSRHRVAVRGSQVVTELALLQVCGAAAMPWERQHTSGAPEQCDGTHPISSHNRRLTRPQTRMQCRQTSSKRNAAHRPSHKQLHRTTPMT